MTVFRGFNCYVENASTAVRAIIEVSINADPTYTQGEVLNWTTSGTGAGVHVSTTDTVLRFYRTSGVLPVVGDSMVGATSSNAATVTAINATDQNGVPLNPPGFKTNTRQNPLSTGDIFRVIQAGNLGIHGVVASTPTLEDEFTLAQTWGGSTLTDVPGIVSQDVTPGFGWELPSQGDNQPIATLRNTVVQIEDQMTTSAWTAMGGLSNNFVGRTTEGQSAPAYTKDVTGRVYLRGAVENTASNAEDRTIFTLPSTHWPVGMMSFAVAVRPVDAPRTTTGYMGQVEVTAAGLIIHRVGLVLDTTPSYVHLDGISFKAE